MNSLKKVFSFLVVFAMMVTMVAPAFAAVPTDVVGTNYEGSVGKMVALGIIAGYPDGSFGPDKEITRAEFSKIACYVIGVQSAADLAKGATKFKDVDGSHWASGYINIASDRGLLKGYPDGTFGADKKVTYAEAITILIRAIGLGPVVDEKGTWPSNYLAKSSEISLTDGVTDLTGTKPAVRGNIAVLGWNTLVAEKWGPKEYAGTGKEVSYGPLGKTLLKEKYSDYTYKNSSDEYVAKFFEDVVVTGTQLHDSSNVGENEVRLEYATIATLLGVTSLSDAPKKVASGNVDEIVVDATGFEPLTLIGKKVDVLFGKDNKVAYLKVKASSVVEGNIDSFKTSENKVTIAGKEYIMASAFDIFANGQTKATLALLETAVSTSTAKATAVLNSDGKVTTLDVFVADTNSTLSTTQFTVKEVKSNYSVVSAQSGVEAFNLDTITGVTNASNKAIIMKNGKTAIKADIKKGDAVSYVVVASGLHYVVASDKIVTGKVSSISPNGNSTYKLTIGDKVYYQAKGTGVASALMTKTGNTDDATVVGDSVTDFQDKDVAVLLNANGLSADHIHSFDSNQSVINFLETFLLADDVILIKGSRGMRMEEIFNWIMKF